MTDNEHAEYQKDMREQYAKAHIESNRRLQERIREVRYAIGGAIPISGNIERAACIEGACRIVAAEIGRGKYP